MAAISRMWRKTNVVLVLAVLASSLGSDSADAGRKKRPKQTESKAAAVELLRYMPNDCATVGTLNFTAVRENSLLKSLLCQDDDCTSA